MPEKKTSLSPLILRAYDRATLTVIVLFGLFPLVGGAVLTPDSLEHDKACERHFTFRVDPNTAEWDELVLLPGIGAKLAEAIIETRDTRGSFRNAGDMVRVKGIATKRSDALRPYLVFPSPRD
ncbi:MAG TPA: hypothetical protein DEB39_10905 [Planctomycetaceae bacterium]|nr:hypothetical protein [Planctomycetaceae bacterium]